MNNDFKILIDTNIVIGLEDPRPVQASLAELVRLSNAHAIGLFVDGANYDDVARDKDAARRAITLSKLDKFQKLRGVPIPADAVLMARFGAIKNDNDRSDARLLVALDAKATDFLVTQDMGLHKRAERAGLGASVFTIDEALQWLKQTFAIQTVSLPYVVERKAYEIDPNHAIFVSLRSDYPGFDQWFDKCRREHRDCWVLEIGSVIAGLVVRKDESHAEAGTRHLGPKILKICTFKVGDEFQGEKLGELLLKQILWHVQRNKYDVVYVTAFPKHSFLIDLLGYYGFKTTSTLTNGEVVLERPIMTGLLPAPICAVYDFDRYHYPRFYDAPTVRKFTIPIRPDYHHRLFPEIAFTTELPLFPTETFGPMLAHGGERTPGNTIRKVYLCRAKSTGLRPGDLLFFYMSKDERYVASQSITTISIVERAVDVTSADDLIKLTAKRSVFSAEELRAMNPSARSPVKMIDFLIVGYLQPVVPLAQLLSLGVFSNRPPQSIAQLTEDGYNALKPYVQLGFDL
jgi:GNAT superfamily N-acetyltransferase